MEEEQFENKKKFKSKHFFGYYQKNWQQQNHFSKKKERIQIEN